MSNVVSSSTEIKIYPRKWEDYTPQKKTKPILDRAWELIESVPYKVTLRWLFYRLYQEGYYNSKGDYTNLAYLTGEARKRQYGEWRPDTLVDEGQINIYRAGGHESVGLALYYLVDKLVDSVSFYLSHFYHQRNYVEIWIEAAAMVNQFKHYSNRVNIRSFGGQAVIDHKYKIATDLNGYAEAFDLPIVILYFGDCDKAGATIKDAAITDIQYWCDHEIDIRFRGLLPRQAIAWDLPEHKDKPGAWQWEAVPDDKAGELITESLAQFLDLSEIDRAIEKEDQAEALWKPRVREALEGLIE